MRHLFLFASLFFLTACSQKKETPATVQSVRLSMSEEPVSLDPRKSRDLTGVNLLHMLFEGLTRTSLNGDVELALAREVTVSEDGLRYQFQLRPSVWSDGTPLTSADFVFAWKEILDPQFPSDIAHQLFPIKNGRRAKLGEVTREAIGIYAPHPETLIVELEQPLPYFLELLAMPPFFPVPQKIALQNPNWALEANSFVSNGPFAMQSWDHTYEVALKKNPRYWKSDEVHFDAVHLIVSPADTALRMFEEGKVDWIGSPLGTIPIDAVQELKRQAQLSASPFLATSFLRVNTSPEIHGKKNPLSSVWLRRALALAVDRKTIAEHLLQGGQKEARALVPPEMGLQSEGYFQEEGASACLEKAREELGDCLAPLVLSYYNNERNAAMAQALQKQWETNLSLRVEIEAVEPKVYFQKVSHREFQLATGSWTADFNDPVNFLEVFKYQDNGTNNTGWEDPQYIDLLNRSQLCRDSEERKQLLREAEALLMDQMPLIPIYHFALNYLKREELDGVFLSPLGQLDLRWAHWELDQPSLSKR